MRVGEILRYTQNHMKLFCNINIEKEKNAYMQSYLYSFKYA